MSYLTAVSMVLMSYLNLDIIPCALTYYYFSIELTNSLIWFRPLRFSSPRPRIEVGKYIIGI